MMCSPVRNSSSEWVHGSTTCDRHTVGRPLSARSWQPVDFALDLSTGVPDPRFLPSWGDALQATPAFVHFVSA